jgi:hypothetical protein
VAQPLVLTMVGDSFSHNFMGNGYEIDVLKNHRQASYNVTLVTLLFPCLLFHLLYVNN